MKYRIAWKSMKTDAIGFGTGLFDKEEAEKIAKQLNISESGKWCFHWAEAEELKPAPSPSSSDAARRGDGR